MAKNKKGADKVEYPKLIKVGVKKIRVLNSEEEAKYMASLDAKNSYDKDNGKPKETKPKGWGN